MKIIHGLLKVVYCTSILLLSIWTLTAVFGSLIPLEFSNNNHEFIYDSILFYGFPIAIILTLAGTIKKDDTRGTIATKVFITILISFISLCIMFMTSFTGMCDWTTDKVYFENKQNPSTTIVQRSFGCGATDSSPATIEVYKLRELTPYLIWVTSADTNQIDKNEWRRIR